MKGKPLRWGPVGLWEEQEEGLSAVVKETGQGETRRLTGRLALPRGLVVPIEFRFYSRCDEKGLEGFGQGNNTDLTSCWRRPFWLWCEQAPGAGAGVEAERGAEAPAVVLGRGDSVASGVGWRY